MSSVPTCLEAVDKLATARSRALSAAAIAWELAFVYAFVLTGMFGVAIALFFAFHLRLVLHNRTTIEFLEKESERHRYSVGARENFLAVFGDRWMLWWVPVWTGPVDPRTDPMAGCAFPERVS
eukprot:TRINITY_DN2327_c0_g1_i1.p5 TRINITY_DN2327_c0_g1~~TRINITY_DN2327_c0_g1_i1.p5  ORF type:complete len:123 (+),score=27.74 TRINITY_DN2327_c0_g1_i1:695-1063(+)